MGKSSWCKTCGDFMLFPESHKCPPIFYVEFGDYMGDELRGKEIRARDNEIAAEKFGEWYDQSMAEYDVAGRDEELTITVYDNPECKNGTMFMVTGEMVPEYHATLIEPGSKNDPAVIAEYDARVTKFNQEHPVGSDVTFKSETGELINAAIKYPARIYSPGCSYLFVEGRNRCVKIEQVQREVDNG